MHAALHDLCVRYDKSSWGPLHAADRYHDPDIVTACDTTTWSALPYYRDASGQFAPLAISCTQPNVLYTTADNGMIGLDPGRQHHVRHHPA